MKTEKQSQTTNANGPLPKAPTNLCTTKNHWLNPLVPAFKMRSTAFTLYYYTVLFTTNNVKTCTFANTTQSTDMYVRASMCAGAGVSVCVCWCYRTTLKRKIHIESSNFHEWERVKEVQQQKMIITFVAFRQATIQFEEMMSTYQMNWIKNDKHIHTLTHSIAWKNSYTTMCCKKWIKNTNICYFLFRRHTQHIHTDSDSVALCAFHLFSTQFHVCLWTLCITSWQSFKATTTIIKINFENWGKFSVWYSHHSNTDLGYIELETERMLHIPSHTRIYLYFIPFQAAADTLTTTILSLCVLLRSDDDEAERMRGSEEIREVRNTLAKISKEQKLNNGR